MRNRRQLLDNQIAEQLQQATTGLRDMIWLLDDSRDTVQDFITRVQQFALPVTDVSGIHISFIIEEAVKDKLLSKSEKRNLFLITKESINNCIKYASCSQIKLSIRQPDNKPVLTIEDNGIGFDEHTITKGNGLYNIRARAKQIYYTADIISSKGNGTQIYIVKM